MKTSALNKIEKHYNYPFLAAASWKNKGGKVVGYFCDSVPEELIQAAGFFPLRIKGDPNGKIDLAQKNLIPRFTTRETFVHSMLDRILSGIYDFLDYLIIPHSRDSIHRLYQLLADLKGKKEFNGLPEIYFIDILHTPFSTSVKYVHDQMLDFKRKLEEWSGKGITDEFLRQTIEKANTNKKLLQKIMKLRLNDPSRISGVDALEMIGSSMFMQKTDHNSLLTQFLETAADLPGNSKPRLFVSGSPLDNTDLYKIIETCGATIVDEDHCWGTRNLNALIDTNSDPTDAVIERYLSKPPCPWMFPTSRRMDLFLQKVASSDVDGVILNVFENDEAEAWEVPDKIKALDEMGIKSLYLENQPYQLSASQSEEIIKRIKKFLEQL